MKDQLIQYIDLLFMGAPDAQDAKQEILQNSLDRYDDLVAAGKSPEEAYQLTIQSIGDLDAILGKHPQLPPYSQSQPPLSAKIIFEKKQNQQDQWWQNLHLEELSPAAIRAIAVALFICCPVPVILLDIIGLDSLGACLLLMMVAAGVALLMVYGKNPQEASPASLVRAVAVAFFICCPVPAILLDIIGLDSLGGCLVLVMVAAGVGLLILCGKDPREMSMSSLVRAAGVACFICCPVPLILLDTIGLDSLGVCLLLMMVAAGVWLLIQSKKDPAAALTLFALLVKWFQNRAAKAKAKPAPEPPADPMARVQKGISTLALILFLLLSFTTGAWYITWLIFPMAFVAKKLARAIFDLMEALTYEE